VTTGCCANAAPAEALALGGVLKTTLLAAPGLTLKPVLVAPVRAPSVADKVNALPTLVGTRFEKVATPLAAATVVVEVPLSTPGLLMPMETFELSVVTMLPNWSSTFTVTAGDIALPACVFDGCCAKASLFAAPGLTVKELLVPVMPELPLIPVAVMVKLPVLVIVTLWLLRTPFVNATVVMGAPTSVPVEVSITLLPFESKLGTVLLFTSWAAIVILKAVPAVCGLLIVVMPK